MCINSIFERRRRRRWRWVKIIFRFITAHIESERVDRNRTDTGNWSKQWVPHTMNKRFRLLLLFFCFMFIYSIIFVRSSKQHPKYCTSNFFSLRKFNAIRVNGFFSLFRLCVHFLRWDRPASSNKTKICECVRKLLSHCKCKDNDSKRMFLFLYIWVR